MTLPRRRLPAALSLLLLPTALLVTTGADVRADVPGTLTLASCIGDGANGVPGDECATVYEAMRGPGGVTLSPDGTRAFVAAFDDDAVVMFDRDPATGQLTPVDCVADVGSPVAAFCGETIEGLDGAWAIAVAQDGGEIFVAGSNDSAVARLSVADSGLTPVGCISDAGTGGCTDASTTGTTLRFVYDIQVRGDDVYALALADAAVVHLRPTATGLTLEACIAKAATAGCTADTNLSRPLSMELSPDGRQAYVSDRGRLHTFDLAADGAITTRACQSRVVTDGVSSLAPCADPSRIDSFYGLTLSPTGSDLYLTSETADEVLHLSRAADGTLAYRGCIADEVPVGAPTPGSGTCARVAEGLDGVNGLTTDPDGDEIVAVSYVRNAAVRLLRGADGSLTSAGCIADTEGTASPLTTCPTTTPGLAEPYDPTISPDGRHLYLSGYRDGTISVFARAGVRPVATFTAPARQRAGALTATVSSTSFTTAALTGTVVVRGATKKPQRFTVRTVRTNLVPGTPRTLPLTTTQSGRLSKLLAVRGARATATLVATVSNSRGDTVKRATVMLRR
ncbi:hypothetical protein [Nocardioides sp.]|uniref:hypothetical protein n=1 Tax=Nocardioides sp. TaxID=35761 RepID=UPI003515006E